MGNARRKNSKTSLVDHVLSRMLQKNTKMTKIPSAGWKTQGFQKHPQWIRSHQGNSLVG